ncbi:hypothetical protein [Sphingomonas aerophila]|uniref:Low affinity Fe/Cu permease n=1 Tax=Sphingomonas aerophila TaxID=1344948 RepID=A0A7W9BGY3_9SPHN|nr:hypothetical protein [Sphingomonas aerophila]MBB5717045.1 low affinity Fe/Cu permease [Sphingomonas aerophila]
MFERFNAFSCAVSERTVAIFADSRMVVLFVALSIASAVFTIAARTELALTLFLSILALAITSAILYVGETREAVARRRDEAMHAKLDSLLRGVEDADDRLAGSEQRLEQALDRGQAPAAD